MLVVWLETSNGLRFLVITRFKSQWQTKAASSVTAYFALLRSLNPSSRMSSTGTPVLWLVVFMGELSNYPDIHPNGGGKQGLCGDLALAFAREGRTEPSPGMRESWATDRLGQLPRHLRL